MTNIFKKLFNNSKTFYSIRNNKNGRFQKVTSFWHLLLLTIKGHKVYVRTQNTVNGQYGLFGVTN